MCTPCCIKVQAEIHYHHPRQAVSPQAPRWRPPLDKHQQQIRTAEVKATPWITPIVM